MKDKNQMTKHIQKLLFLGLLLLVVSCNEGQSAVYATTKASPSSVAKTRVADHDKTPVDVPVAPLVAPVPPGKAKPLSIEPKANDTCATICRRSNELNCKIQSDQCINVCREMQDVPVCKAEMEKVVSCMVSRSATDWECSEEGIAALKNGACDSQQNGFINCMMKSS